MLLFRTQTVISGGGGRRQTPSQAPRSDFSLSLSTKPGSPRRGGQPRPDSPKLAAKGASLGRRSSSPQEASLFRGRGGRERREWQGRASGRAKPKGERGEAGQELLLAQPETCWDSVAGDKGGRREARIAASGKEKARGAPRSSERLMLLAAPLLELLSGKLEAPPREQQQQQQQEEAPSSNRRVWGRGGRGGGGAFARPPSLPSRALQPPPRLLGGKEGNERAADHTWKPHLPAGSFGQAIAESAIQAHARASALCSPPPENPPPPPRRELVTPVTCWCEAVARPLHMLRSTGLLPCVWAAEPGSNWALCHRATAQVLIQRSFRKGGRGFLELAPESPYFCTWNWELVR